MTFPGGSDPRWQPPYNPLVTPYNAVDPYSPMQPWPLAQPTMLGDGTFTKTLKRSFFHIALDVVLIALGISLLRSSRERRRHVEAGAAAPPKVVNVEPPSPAFSLYETGVETALRVVQCLVLSNVAMNQAELARLRGLGANCERLLHAPRSSWSGRSRTGEPTAWFARVDFVLLQRALNTVASGAVHVTTDEAKRFTLLLDLVSLSLSTLS